MNSTIQIGCKDILKYLKISCQLPKILEGVITNKIIQDKAKELDISLKLEELQQAADNFRRERQLYSIEDTQSWLQRHYLSLNDFDNLVEFQSISRKLVEHLFGDRVAAFFQEHKQNYVGVAMYEVVLDDEDLAIKLFWNLKQGEISFREVARQYISQPSWRYSGGYRGILYHHQLPPEIADEVFGVTPPKLLQPIITSTGIHLIFVEEIIQPQLDEQLRLQILYDFYAEWLRQQTAEIEVIHQWNND